MAQVLSPFLPQPDSISYHQGRPSTPDTFPVVVAESPQRQSRAFQVPRSQHSNYAGSSAYRGTPAAPSNPQFSFKAMPLKHDNRAVSAPLQQPLAAATGSTHNRQRYPTPDSVSSISSISSIDGPGTSQVPYSKDDALLFTNYEAPTFSNDPNPQDAIRLPVTQIPQETPAPASPSKSITERYKRGHRRGESSVASAASDVSTGSIAISTASVGHIFQRPQQVSVSSPTVEKPPQTFGQELPKRYRHGSSRSIDGTAKLIPGSPLVTTQNVPTTGAFVQNSYPHDTRPLIGQESLEQSTGSRSTMSPDTVRRANNPSPLSRPMTAESQQSVNTTISPAVAAMAALNERDAGKTVKSRLRRAFSFGSAAELKHASGESTSATDRAKIRQEQFSNRLDIEKETSHKRQESTGSTSGVYSGQYSGFSGSTDNLSISSTASSASLMLRKMGTGMRKGSRSLKGLFRPKSVVGVPSVDAAFQASIGPVSFVNVEAEREQVNVNVDPHDQAGGGTGFPRLERNSVDAAKLGQHPIEPVRPSISSRDSLNNENRRSVLGSEQERVEALAAVKRGILKRAGTVPVQISIPNDGADDHYIPLYNNKLERQQSPVPSTTSSEFHRPRFHERSDSSTYDNDEYFMGRTKRFSGLRITKSLPGTPRSITFSPRIQFYDVWSANDYDRRGDIATCNRLTPLLAQQIKEELNNFKMEMEVHENSKPYTHFF